MDCHNFGFGTGYELFDDKQRLVDKNFNPFVPDIEGEVETTVTDTASGKILEKHKQPMRSFVSGMIYAIINGGRIYNKVDLGTQGYARRGPGLVLGNLTDNVTIHTKDWASSGGYTGIPTAEQTGSVSASYPTQMSDYVEITITATVHVSNGGTISSVRNACGLNVSGHYSLGSAGTSTAIIIAADKLPNITFAASTTSTILISYTLHFLNSTSKTLTMNWFMNFIANLVGSYDFTTINDLTRSKTVTNQTTATKDRHQTFTFLDSTRARIELGPDDTQPVLITNTKLSPWTGGTLSVFSQLNSNFPTVSMSYNSESGIDYINNTARCVCYTTWQNITQNPVTVKEAGLIVNENRTDSTITGINGTGEFLLARWLTGPVELLPGWSLKVYFQPQVTC